MQPGWEANVFSRPKRCKFVIMRGQRKCLYIVYEIKYI